MATSQDFVNWVCSDAIDSQFLKYVLLAEHESMLRFASGTTHQTIYYPEAKAFHVCLPSVREQRAIAQVLGSLDEKIERNREMSATLEEIASTLFKSWFVDFDPVRAKRPDQEDGVLGSLAVLFPDALEASDTGVAPRGWPMCQLGELVDTVKGQSYKSEELTASETALVTLKSFARGGGYRLEGLKGYAGPYKLEQVVRPGEVVIACTDVTQAADVIGRPAVVRGSQQYDTLVASLDTMIVRPRKDAITTSFLYFLAKTPAFTAHTYAHTSGTTVLHLAKDAIASFRFPVPPRALVQAFDSFAQKALERIQALHDEAAILEEMRDALLPQLVSGRLRVGSLVSDGPRRRVESE